MARLQRAHREALQKWLARRPQFRPAVESDCTDTQGLALQREEDGTLYDPYYVVGDFNKDDNDDFAVALINRTKTSFKFALVIFNGDASGHFVPAYFAEQFDLTSGGLFYIGYGRGDRLAVGVFASDQCDGFRPRGGTYVKYHCPPQ